MYDGRDISKENYKEILRGIKELFDYCDSIIPGSNRSGLFEFFPEECEDRAVYEYQLLGLTKENSYEQIPDLEKIQDSPEYLAFEEKQKSALKAYTAAKRVLRKHFSA